MKSDTIILVDIETIKDPVVLGDWPTNKWPPPIGWRVVAIGMVLARFERAAGSGGALCIEHSGCMTGGEDELISKFWSFFDRRKPVLVTWNGRGFDLPVLLQRAFIKGVPTPRWFQAGNRYEGYPYRYSGEWHCDLMDQLCDYGASPKLGMDIVARATGLPGKIGGDGAAVEAMWNAGEIAKIAVYCECDVLNLYGLYLRWLFLTGRIGTEGHVASLRQFEEFTRASDKPYCAEFSSSGFLSPFGRAAEPVMERPSAIA